MWGRQSTALQRLKTSPSLYEPMVCVMYSYATERIIRDVPCMRACTRGARASVVAMVQGIDEVGRVMSSCAGACKCLISRSGAAVHAIKLYMDSMVVLGSMCPQAHCVVVARCKTRLHLHS